MKLSFSLLVLAWKQTEEVVCRVGGITCNAEGFAGEMGAVDVLEGGERDANDLLNCSHYPLKGLAAGRVAGAIPHSYAASQNALDGASVEGAHDGGRGSGSSEFAEEVEMLLCFLGQCCSVVGPGEVLCDVYTQELGAAHSLHGRTIDGQRSMQRVHSPEVNNNLLRLLHTHFFFLLSTIFYFHFFHKQHNIISKIKQNKTADTYSTSQSSVKREGEREGQQEHKSYSFK